MRFDKKYKIALVSILTLLLVIFILRTQILHFVFNRIQQKLKKDYALTLQADQVSFTGVKTVFFRNLKLSQDTNLFLHIDSLSLNPRFFPLFIGKLLIKEIDIQQGKFNMDIQHLRNIKKHTGNQAVDSLTSVANSITNYSKVAYNLINSYFQHIPSRLNINQFDIAYKRDTLHLSVSLNQFTLKNNTFKGNLLFIDNKINESLIIKGTMNSSDNLLSFDIENSNKKSIQLPYLQLRWNTVISFDSLSGYFGVDDYSSGMLRLKLSSGIKNFIIQNNQVGPDPVITHIGKADLQINITERAIEIDSTSTVTFNQFQFSPYIRYSRNPSQNVELKIIKQEFEAMKLFKSFPEGLFDYIPDMETKGNLIYSLNASLNLDHPDSAVLDSRLDKKDFSIINYGDEDFRKMNGEFKYDVYDHDRYVRSFIIGPENSDFTSLDQISPYLKFSVLTSEDGDFFYHRGFNEKAFRESISKNFREKRFARGGSTISMQLVKNVFLSRKKTIARKLEEMLIVWMIENMHLTSKERMFEVYLNIIEWGPDIYGIKEAARFYFNKLPSQLTLKESIYLVSIIPRPKGFKYAFDGSGHLREHYAGYYRLLTSIMLRRNQISAMDTSNLKPDVELIGAAKYYLTQPDTTREDSIFFLEPKGFLLESSPLKVEENDKKTENKQEK